MKKMLLYYIIFIISNNLNAILEVSLDGTKPFTVIQEAIDQTTYNDTVLVYPGRYFENLDLSDTDNIRLFSLEASTNDTTYISSTIIDGSQHENALIYLMSNNSDTIVRGFTLTHGQGFNSYLGGGVYVKYSTVHLINLVIRDNYTHTGGGIYISSPSTVYLEGCVIRNNIAVRAGGGICIFRSGGEASEIFFSEENRCSLYNNCAKNGTDIYYSGHFGATCDVYLDKFTVSYPHRYYANYFDSYFLLEELGFTPFPVFDINEGFVEEVDADLYVANSGSDNNSGLTPDEPLRTTFKAYQKIMSNPYNQRTVHLPAETYSHDLWGHQNLPIGIKSNTRLKGFSPEETKLYWNDTLATYRTGILNPQWVSENITIENITLTSLESYVLYTSVSHNLKLKNIVVENSDISTMTMILIEGKWTTSVQFEDVVIRNNFTNSMEGLVSIKALDTTFANVVFEGNVAEDDYDGYIGLFSIEACNSVKITNSKFINNESYVASGGGSFLRVIQDSDSDSLRIVVDNCIFSDNRVNESVHNFIFLGNQTTVTNCTFANNQLEDSWGAIRLSGQADVRNSIFYNNSIVYDVTYSEGVGNIDNCLFDDEEIDYHTYGVVDLTIGENNIYNEDPLFVGGDEAIAEYYMLQGSDMGQASPAIDAGTSDLDFLPDWYVSQQTDLYGMERVVGNVIDIGCYEYQGYTGNSVDIEHLTGLTAMNYPNPFNPETTIQFNNPKSGKVTLDIYNMRGQLVKTLVNKEMNQGIIRVVWNGKDDNDNTSASGIYFYKISIGNANVTKKILLMK